MLVVCKVNNPANDYNKNSSSAVQKKTLNHPPHPSRKNIFVPLNELRNKYYP